MHNGQCTYYMNMNMHTLMCMCMSNDVHANRGDLRGYAERGYGTASRATASTTRATAYRRGGARGGLRRGGVYGKRYEGYGGEPAYDSEPYDEHFDG